MRPPVCMAEEVETGLGERQVLQRALQESPIPVILRRDISSEHELAVYLREQFPDAARRGNRLSLIRGGRSRAEQLLSAIDPVRYGQTRNFLGGAVTRLSPYIRHGVLSLGEVFRAAAGKAGAVERITKFVSELAWRDYYQRLYAELGEAVWLDQEAYKTGYAPGDYVQALPEDIERGETGLACMDAFSRELRESGYLHNHARMWLAAYVVHWRRAAWQAGARWFLTHLLDGDPASNNLSWQWVASTFSSKPYYFNRENLERYTGGVHCRDCARRGRCDFEGSYEELGARLFRLEVTR